VKYLRSFLTAMLWAVGLGRYSCPKCGGHLRPPNMVGEGEMMQARTLEGKEVAIVSAGRRRRSMMTGKVNTRPG